MWHRVRPMLALVTGGAGFIGSNIVDALLEQGDEVRVLDDLSSGFRENVNPEAELFEGDITDLDLLGKACAGAEVVFHQAALRSVFRSVEQPLPSDTANTHGTLSVLHAAHQAGARRVVSASSSSVYGGAPGRATPRARPPTPPPPPAGS